MSELEYFLSVKNIEISLYAQAQQLLLRQDFRTGPYFIMHTVLCFKKTIAITIDALWECSALFFLFKGFLF